MAGRKLIVIVDGQTDTEHVAEWQRRALATLPADDRLIFLVCTNTHLKPRLVRHPLYYAINLLAVRNRLTRQVPIGGISAQIEARHTFASQPDGAWQVLPVDIVEMINRYRADAVIKLGMGLMRVPSELRIPILSWHHGDPEHFRGRPAGFWELVGGRPVVGQMVQILSNKLDAGAVVAFAETRALPYSWKATLIESFRHSPLLLGPALERAMAGTVLPKPANGRNYRLPSNWQVLRLLLKLGGSKLRRILYGALIEKRWRVALAPLAESENVAAILQGSAPLSAPSQWIMPPVPEGCTFIADPFFAENGSDLLVEALSARSGKGELHRISADGSTQLSTDSGHHSYPALVRQGDDCYCVPEIAQWSAPAVYRYNPSWERVAELDIPGKPHLVDPSFVTHEGRLYLFANRSDEGSSVLRLWFAPDLFGRFAEHPASPVLISPRGARMGGEIVQADGQLIRIGQDFTRDYGDGLISFAIDSLTPDRYLEREIGTFRLADRKGPHTFNLAPDGRSVLFDWYREGFSPLAGVRRLIARLSYK